MIELGRLGRDKITGFQGILIGKCTYLTGCDQYGLAPPAKDAKLEATTWFDEARIEIIGPGIHKDEVTSAKNGGPNRDSP
jgi:hypothetical protein